MQGGDDRRGDRCRRRPEPGRTYGSDSSAFTAPDQGGTGETYTYASANPLVLSDPLGLFSWSNFMEDVNTVSSWVSTGASLVAVGCTAAVICAPAAPGAGASAGVGTVVNVASGAAISAESCATRKGSCAGQVAASAIGMFGSRFGAGRLASRASEQTVAMGRNMTDRVIPYARTHGYGYYAGTPSWIPRRTIERSMGADRLRSVDLWFNRAWIRGQMRQGHRIVDIGEPPGYRPSEFYDMELNEVSGYWNYTRDPQP